MKREEINEQIELFQSVQYRADEEGFDYCFDGYSDWSEIKDLHFHELRQDYLNAKNTLDMYIENKVHELLNKLK